MRRIFKTIFLLIVFSSLLSISTYAEHVNELNVDIPDSAGYVYFYSYNAERALMSKGSNTPTPPGATAKMMAGIVVCYEYEDRFDEKITITPQMLTGIEGASMNLQPGMTVSIKDLLYGTVCGGNNDAAQALAVACSGSVSEFVEIMNKYARRFDMRDTKYVNPTGIDTKVATTTPFDVFKLSSVALSNKTYLEISSTQSYKIDTGPQALTIYNRNALISQFSAQGYVNKNAKGLISGNTDEGGYVLSAYAEKEGCSYLCIIMNASSNTENIFSYSTANDLFKYAFSNYSYKKVLSESESVIDCNILLALNSNNDSKVSCSPEKDIYAFVDSDFDTSKISLVPYLHNESLKAPVEKGTVVGGVDVYYNDQIIACEKLICNSYVAPNTVLYILDVMQNFFISRVFIISSVLSITFIGIYLLSGRKSSRYKRIRGVEYKKFH